MKKFNKKLFLTAIAAATSFSSLNANAQLEEIVVTAQGRVQSLNDVPVSVSVISGEDLDKMGITNLQDVSSRTPNVNIATGPIESVNIRGVGSGTNWGFQQSVGTFVDGIYRSRARSIQAALFDVDRVEILKGPQTTFFGANSIAGALNITTRKPTDESGYNVTALYGDDGEYNLEGGVNMPVSDTFKVRVAARMNGMDGYLKTLNGDAPNVDNKQGRVSAVWNPTDTFESEFRFDYGDSETVGALAYQLIGCPAPNGSAGTACALFLANNGGVIDDKLDYNSDTGLDFINLKHSEMAWTNTFDVGESSKLILKTGYYDHDAKSLFTGIPFPAVNNGNTPLPPFLGVLRGAEDPFWIAGNEDYNQFSQEIRLQSDTGGFFDYMVGAYYSKDEMAFSNNVHFAFNDFGFIASQLVAPNLPGFLQPLVAGHTLAPGDVYSAHLTNDTENETYSAFFATTFRPTDKLTLNVGGRYTKFDKTAHRANVLGFSDLGFNIVGVPFANPANTNLLQFTLGGDYGDFATTNIVDKEFMPSISAQYDISDDVMGYVNYSEGFKAGGFSASNRPDLFKPEYVDAYELGIKGDFLDGKLRANVAYFFNEYTDLQESVVVSTGISLESVVKNIGKSESSGLELDGQLFITDNLTLNLSLAFLDSVYKEFPNAACTAEQALDAGGTDQDCVQDVSGKNRAYAPEWSGSLGLSYKMGVGDNYTMSIEPSIFFTDDYFLSSLADPWEAQESYTKVDMRIGLTPNDGNWSVALIGKNLNDEITASYSSTVSNSDGQFRQIVDRPRSFALQFTYNY